MRFNLSDKVVQFLQANLDKKFTAREIGQWVCDSYPDECHRKKERSTAKVSPINSEGALIQQIAAEIGSQRPRLQKRNSKIKTTEGRPRKYYYTPSSDNDEINQIEANELAQTSNSDEIKITEYALYPVLAEFLTSEFSIYSKRIDEKRSSNNQGPGGNKWLYADMVGLEDLSREWHSEVKGCVKKYADKMTKLWSFEVKRRINRSNVRKAFFQAVSNSSWANFGYLVAGDIEGANTLKELRMLASLHGIGFINLDVQNPSESQIIIQAKERAEIDWDIANRLTTENKDFQEYIKLVRQFYQTGEIRKTDWRT